MSSSYITISYHNMFFYFISSAALISIPFCSILFYSTLFQIDSILFYSIEFDLLYCSVLYLISMNDLCLSVRLFVCLFICMNKFMFSLLFLFCFPFFSFLMNVFLTHTHGHGHGHTNTYEYMFLLMTRTYYFKSA